MGDVDRMVTCLTEERGRLDVVVKGIRKKESKLQASVQPLMLLEMYVIAQRRYTLGGSVILNSFPALRESLRLQWTVLHINELLCKMTRPEHKDPGIFALYLHALETLQKNPKIAPERLIFFTLAFDLKFLELSGHRPVLYPEDHLQEEDFFALHSEGLMPLSQSKQRPTVRISKPLRSLLRFALSEPLPDVLAVALTLTQARQLAFCSSVLMEDHNVLPFATDAFARELGLLSKRTEKFDIL